MPTIEHPALGTLSIKREIVDTVPSHEVTIGEDRSHVFANYNNNSLPLKGTNCVHAPSANVYAYIVTLIANVNMFYKANNLQMLHTILHIQIQCTLKHGSCETALLDTVNKLRQDYSRHFQAPQMDINKS